MKSAFLNIFGEKNYISVNNIANKNGVNDSNLVSNWSESAHQIDADDAIFQFTSTNDIEQMPKPCYIL